MSFPEIVLIITNIIFISIPEELFLVLFTLSLLGKFEMFSKLNKRKVFMLSIPVVIPAIISNTIREIFKNRIDIMPVIGIFMISLAIILTYGISDKKEIVKCFIFNTLAFIVATIIQFIFFTIITYCTTITMESISKMQFMNIPLSIPEKFIYILVILIFTLNRNRDKVNLLRAILNNTSYIVLTILVLAINLSLVYFLGLSILYNKILYNFDALSQIAILILITIFPILNILTFFIALYYHTYKDSNQKRFVSAELKALKYNIKKMYEKNDINGIIREVNVFTEFWEDKEKYII